MGQTTQAISGDAQPAILVVEDNVVNRLVITSFLDEIDCKISYAENGQIAIDKFEQQRADLILMDINMPVMDGITATENIRNIERKEKIPHTPIVAVTAHDDEDHRLRCNMAGMDGFVAKPITGENIKSIVSLWLYGTMNPADTKTAKAS